MSLKYVWDVKGTNERRLEAGRGSQGAGVGLDLLDL